MIISCVRTNCWMLGLFFMLPLAGTAGAAETGMIAKETQRSFIQTLEKGSRPEILESARETFEKGALLADGYSFLFGNYKSKSDFETSDYVFLNEEAFGGVVWRIQIKVRNSDGEILDFYAGARKEVL